MNERNAIYDEACRVLTDYEYSLVSKEDLYEMLLKIVNNWETIITSEL